MNYKVKLVADAKNDFAEAHMYYFKISPKVALKFKDEVKSAIEHLEKNPFYELRTRNFRAIPLKKFAYFIFYEVNENLKEVKIVAIFNTNRDTEKYPR